MYSLRPRQIVATTFVLLCYMCLRFRALVFTVRGASPVYDSHITDTTILKHTEAGIEPTPQLSKTT